MVSRIVTAETVRTGCATRSEMIAPSDLQLPGRLLLNAFHRVFDAWFLWSCAR